MRTFLRHLVGRFFHSPSRAEVVAWVVGGCVLTSGIAGGGIYLSAQQTAVTSDLAATDSTEAATATTSTTDTTALTTATTPATDETSTTPDTTATPTVTATATAAPPPTTTTTSVLADRTAMPTTGLAVTPPPTVAPVTSQPLVGPPGGWPVPPTPVVKAIPATGQWANRAVSDAVTIDWFAPNVGPNDVYRIKRTDTAEVRVLKSGQNLFPWSGLAPATTYTFVMWGENESGRGAEGSVTVQTHPDTAPRLTAASLTSSHVVARGDKVTLHVTAPNLAAVAVSFKNAEGLTARCDSFSADCTVATTNLDAGRWRVEFVVFTDTTDRSTFSYPDQTTMYVNCFGPSTHGVDLTGLWFDLA